VLIDATTWLDGVHDGTVCESGSGVPLPPDTVRRLLCIAELTYGILINGRLVASVSGNDLATPDQRDQLRSSRPTGADRPTDALRRVVRSLSRRHPGAPIRVAAASATDAGI
jgi:hypothetical protein